MKSPRHIAALAYAAAGVPVFPCIVNGKRPATANGFHGATTDRTQIDAWWGQADYNLAIEPETAGWAVVDLDGAEGKATWGDIAEAFEPTYEVTTPSGGRHIYFTGSLASSVRKLGPGIDTRGRGGYVLMPPSAIDGRPYVGSSTTIDPVDMPAWLPERLAMRDREHKAAEVADLDLPVNVDRARTYLRSMVERGAVAIKGQGADAQTYQIACALKDLGLSQETAAAMMVEHWYPHCYPNDNPSFVESKVAHAYEYGQNEPGAWALSQEPIVTAEHAAALAAATAPPPIGARFKSLRALAGMTFDPPEWIWRDRLLAAEPNLYTGEPGVGKTTVAENIAVAVAAGIPFLGHETRRGPVYLLVAEDRYGPVRDNLLAIRRAMNAPDEVLDRIHILSVKSDRIEGGHALARITDDGSVVIGRFMGEVVAPALATADRPLLVLDPIAELVRFNHMADDACRALATTFLRDVCEIGRTTVLANDHPSKASVASEHYYAGSTQLLAAFSFAATILRIGKRTGLARQQEMQFKVLKGRYAEETETTFFRVGASPAFVTAEALGQTPEAIRDRVFKHVVERIERDLRSQETNHGEHGPEAISHWLGLNQKDVVAALKLLRGNGWLGYERSQPGRGGAQAGFTIGAQAPINLA